MVDIWLMMVIEWVSQVMGVPQARWMVFVRENSKLKWMMTGGTLIAGNLQIYTFLFLKDKGPRTQKLESDPEDLFLGKPIVSREFLMGNITIETGN